MVCWVRLMRPAELPDPTCQPPRSHVLVPLPACAPCSWEICVSATDGQFQQVSFVNSICTSKGGTHVDYLVNQIAK